MHVCHVSFFFSSPLLLLFSSLPSRSSLSLESASLSSSTLSLFPSLSLPSPLSFCISLLPPLSFFQSTLTASVTFFHVFILYLASIAKSLENASSTPIDSSERTILIRRDSSSPSCVYTRSMSPILASFKNFVSEPLTTVPEVTILPLPHRTISFSNSSNFKPPLLHSSFFCSSYNFSFCSFSSSLCFSAMA